MEANDDELDIFYNVTKNTRKSWYNTITELEKLIIAEDNNEQSIISKIAPDHKESYGPLGRSSTED